MQLGDHLAAGAEKYALEEKQRAERRVRLAQYQQSPHNTQHACGPQVVYCASSLKPCMGSSNVKAAAKAFSVACSC